MDSKYFVATATSKDDRRPALQLIEALPDTLAASDGNRLHVTPNPGLETGKYSVLKNNMKETSLEASDYPHNFPDWKQIIAGLPGEGVSMEVNPAYLIEALKGLDKNADMVRLTIRRSGKISWLEVQTPEPVKQYALIMDMQDEGQEFYKP